MNPSSTPGSVCPECGAPLTPGAAQGLCARCLMLGAAASSEPAPPAKSPPPSLEAVAAAFPQFEVLEAIGHGGMGAVFKVRQPKLNRFAALKLLPESLAADPAFAGRFEREAQLLARLSHPNIVSVYDYGQAGEFFFLLMEFVDGVNLRQAMRASRFTPAQALAIVPKICEALQYAHEEGVLHRDIKPENILLDSKGRVKLVDFGIAKLIGDGTHETHGSQQSRSENFTETGATLGTPQYMAPEQRYTPSDVDHRADIYSLGVVFYELLTGELPIGKFAPPSTLSAADPRVDAIVQQALEKERERRQRSAGEMKTQVETLGGAAATAVPRLAVQTSAASPRSAALVKVPRIVTAPAIAMIILGGLGLFGKLIGVLAVLLVAAGIVPYLGGSITSQVPFHIVSLGATAASILVGLLLLSGLALSVFVFVAGLRMRCLRSRGLAIAGSIVLIVTALLSMLSPSASSQAPMLTTSGWSLIEIAVGIWALVVLLRLDVSEAFEHAGSLQRATAGDLPEAPLASASADARSAVGAPAAGLMVASSLNLLLFGAALLFLLFGVGWHTSPTEEVMSFGVPGLSISRTGPPTSVRPAWITVAPILFFCAFVPSLLTFIGAWRMRQLRGYGLAITAAIFGILTPPGLLIGVIFGLWALVVLSQREVRAAFDVADR